MFYKKEIRKKIRNRRRQLDSTTVDVASKQVTAQIINLPCFIDSKTVGLYLPQENEIDTTPTLQCAHELNKQLFLPVTPEETRNPLLFYSYRMNDPLIKNRFGIAEPDTKKQSIIEPRLLDIIITPLVAFDQHGNRIGRGAGYYDTTLGFINDTESKRPILIGFAYEFQKIEAIEPQKWDVSLDYVITEQQVYQGQQP